jgi:hypothetical protein
MKKVLIVVAAVLLSISALAQAEHLKFKGIPIDGEYKAFAEQLVQKGFKQIETSADGIVLSGNFMAIPGVMVLIYPDPTSKRVSSVCAMIEAGDNWAKIEAKYYDVIDIYKEKYGEPTQHIEEFTVDVHNDDYFRKSALHDGQCNYKSLWETEGGRIVLSLAYIQLKYYVICAYVDEQNVKALRQTIIDDI